MQIIRFSSNQQLTCSGSGAGDAEAEPQNVRDPVGQGQGQRQQVGGGGNRPPLLNFRADGKSFFLSENSLTKMQNSGLKSLNFGNLWTKLKFLEPAISPVRNFQLPSWKFATS